MSKQPKCWLIWLLLLPLLFILYYFSGFGSTVFPTTVKSGNKICTTRECTIAAATLTNNMNEKVNPCDDFTEFVCGNYKLHHNVHDGESEFTIFDTLEELLTNKLKLLLEAPQSPTDKPWNALPKAYYQKCIDSKANGTIGRAAILALLDEIGGWPMMNPNWTPFNTSSEEYIASIHQKYLAPILFQWQISVDDANTSDVALHLYPVYDSVTPEAVEELFRFLDAAEYKASAKELLEKYTNFLNMILDSDSKIGPLHMMKKEVPHFDIEGYARRFFDGIHPVNLNMTVAIYTFDLFDKLHTLFPDKRDLANFAGLMVALHLYQQPYSNRLRNTKFGELQCIESMMEDFKVPLAHIYADAYHNRDVVTPKIKEMLSLIKGSLRDMLNEATWLDDYTRQNAIKKLDAMKDYIGYPDEWFNETYMNEHFSIPLPTPTEHFYTFFARVSKQLIASKIANLEHYLHFKYIALGVNGFYRIDENVLALLLPMLEHPFYQSNVPDYVNYAGIGHVIGHEVMHGFDNEGSTWDAHGHKINWWTNETAKHYKKKEKCFVNQYDNHGVDGSNSLGENIADNVGFTLIYNAYKKSRALKSDPVEPALPGFEKYTVDQMFFILSTSKWCDIVKQEPSFTNDPHPSGTLRAIIPMKNSKEYSDAFKCLKTDTMNPAEKCSLW